MAQIGTDAIEQIVVGQAVPFVAPYNGTIVGVAPSLGTAGSTTTTFTLNKNGSTTGVTPTLGSAAVSAAASACSVSIVSGDVVTVTAAYGTTAANGGLSLSIQRA